MSNIASYHPGMSCILICLMAHFFIVPSARSQNDDKVVILNHADSLVGGEVNGERVKELIGNVKFTQGSIVVTCKKALQFLTSNKISLEGDVEILDSAMRMVGVRGMYYSDDRVAEAFERVMVEDTNSTLRADYGKYFVKEKKAFFRSNVSVEDSGSVLTADEMTYYRDPQKSIAVGNVVIMNHARTMTITGNHFENFRKQHYSRMTDGPKFFQVDTTGSHKDTLIVTSRVMESYQDSSERLIATDSVRLRRADMQGKSGHAVFLTKLDSIILRQAPFIWYTTDSGEQNQLSGDSLFLHLVRRKLDRVYVRGHAHALAEVDSVYPKRYNQMTGQEIVMYFKESKILRIDVNLTATSLYYLFDGKKPNGVNKTSGDQVRITFLNGKIDKLKVTNSIEGQYYPERLVANKEGEYDLPGFNWKGRRVNIQAKNPGAAPVSK
jgi:lipopolysaccharide export system protein LptA